MAPPFHPLAFASFKHPLITVKSINPLVESSFVADFPMAILDKGTPETLLISKRDVLGNALARERSRREGQVV